METGMSHQETREQEQEQIKLVNNILKRMGIYLTMQILGKTEEEKEEIKKKLENVRNWVKKMENKPHENIIVITTLLTKEERYVSGLLGLKTINNVFSIDKIGKLGVKNEHFEKLIENLNIPFFLSDNKQPTPRKLANEFVKQVLGIFKPTTN